MSGSILFLLILVCVLLYFTAFISDIFKKRICKSCWLAAVTVNILLIINNFAVNGYVPFVSVFQILIFLAALFPLVYLYVARMTGSREYRNVFILSSALVLCGPLFMEKKAEWTFPPALRSVYFIPHIFVYMIAYTLGAVALMITVISLIRHKENDKTPYLCIRTLFPFMTSGMLLGAVWANQVWGQFWAFDIKECWSLITWLTYMLYLHCARRKKLRKYMPYLALLGFIGIIVTFFFARISGVSSNHSYS